MPEYTTLAKAYPLDRHILAILCNNSGRWITYNNLPSTSIEALRAIVWRINRVLPKDCYIESRLEVGYRFMRVQKQQNTPTQQQLMIHDKHWLVE